MFDWLIVGAGLTGITFAERVANCFGKKVLIVEKRNHIGGNAYDSYDSNGVLIHHYGPHIFHTKSKKIWDYISKFTDWNFYQHEVLASVDNKLLPLPFNLNSLRTSFSNEDASRIEYLLLDSYKLNSNISVLSTLLTSSNKDFQYLGKFIYDKIIYGYTKKQWGVTPDCLDREIFNRIPMRVSWDNRYFQDPYQGVPKYGYTQMFKNMLRNKNIEVILNTDYRRIFNEIQFDRVLYTGPIDNFFDYTHGELPYRSLKFDFAFYPCDFYQRTAQVNYPNDYDFTRISEFKYMTQQKIDGTTIVQEFPQPYIRDKNEPLYPILNKASRYQHALYLKEARKVSKTILFSGRLADYRYYNMDHAVARVLKLFKDKVLT